MPTAELTIVIVSWNVKDLLKKCLASIFENRGNLDLAVIVADNASADQTAAMVKNDFPQVKLIANDKKPSICATLLLIRMLRCCF